MAIFNPQVQPTNDPNYLGYSKGIEGGYGVDKSKGIALETAGSGIEGAVSIADTGVKDYLKDNIRDTVEKQRSDYTQYLETLKTMAAANKIPGASTDSLMDANASADIPDGLQAGLDRAANIAAGGNTGNRINDTLYTANLASSASELRAKWPGYKDYIDEKFSSYSGMNPANAYYKNLMQDINTLAARTDKTGAQSIINEAVKSGDVPDADKIWSLHKAINPKTGQPYMSDDEAIHQIYQAKAAKAAATAMEAARTARQGDRADTAAVATRDFSKEFGDTVNRSMALIQIGTGTQTLQGAVNRLTQMGQNPDDIDNKQVQAIVTALQAKRNELYQGGLARATERDSTGQTYITRMGGVAKVKEELDGNLSGLDEYIKSVNDKNWGIGTYIQRRMTAQSDVDQTNLLDNPDIGPSMRKVQALQKIAPNFSDTFTKAILASNVPEGLQNYFTEKRMDVAIQPDFLSKGAVTTLQQVSDGIDKKIGSNPKYTPTDIAKLKTEVFNIPKAIGDPKADLELKANLARGAFDPANIGILQGLKMDYYDPVRKMNIPGKYSAFTRMTSPDITDGMDAVRKGTQDGPQLWENYKNWTQTEFQKLFRQDIVDLGKATSSPLNNISGKIHVGWSSGENGQPPQLKLLDENGNDLNDVRVPGQMGQSPQTLVGDQARTIKATIARINTAMYDLHQVYRKDGEDTNMPILKDLMQNWSPNGETVTGLPGKVMDAIRLANQSKFKPEPAKAGAPTYGDK